MQGEFIFTLKKICIFRFFWCSLQGLYDWKRETKYAKGI